MKIDWKIIDLTHPLDKSVRYWNGKQSFSLTTTLDYKHQIGPVKFRTQRIKMDAGTGTHIDTPSHCFADGVTVPQIPVDHLFRTCSVIDVSSKVSADLSITIDDLYAFEAKHGSIKPGSWIIFFTGWSTHWESPLEYRNNYQFPSISKELAAHLATMDIVGIGIDTLSPDTPANGFHTHKLLLEKGKYILENIANCHLMPPNDSMLLVAPLLIKEATEVPVRLFCLMQIEK